MLIYVFVFSRGDLVIKYAHKIACADKLCLAIKSGCWIKPGVKYFFDEM